MLPYYKLVKTDQTVFATNFLFFWKTEMHVSQGYTYCLAKLQELAFASLVVQS